MESRGLEEGQSASSIGPLYIVYFNSSHDNFRLAEFRAGADYVNTSYAFAPVPMNRMPFHAMECDKTSWRDPIDLTFDAKESKKGLNVARPFMLVYLPSDQVAQQLCIRATCIRSIWQHWASGCTIEEVQGQMRTEKGRTMWSPYLDEKISWRTTIISYQRSQSMEEQVNRVNLLNDVFELPGPIKMKGADLDIGYMEEWTAPSMLPEEEMERLDLNLYKEEVRTPGIKKGGRIQRQRLVSVHVGKKVTDGLARELVAKMDVKKRRYIGNTTMEAQMSLIQAIMALSGPGKVIYDPFAGTCSILLAAAALGAHVVASDIDGRMMRGKAKQGDQVDVLKSAKQYRVEDNFMDFVCADISQHPWRGNALFDAIVADPPYGVRAGAKQLGRRDPDKQRDTPVIFKDGTYSHEQPDYNPPTKPYALDRLLFDLMNFSAKLLVPNGRLVFWMPTMIESDKSNSNEEVMQELQLELTPDFRLVAHSLQDFGLWGRRLITLEKVQNPRGNTNTGAAVLPSAPARHLQSTSTERIRATDDPDEFRNKFFYGSRTRA